MLQYTKLYLVISYSITSYMYSLGSLLLQRYCTHVKLHETIIIMIIIMIIMIIIMIIINIILIIVIIIIIVIYCLFSFIYCYYYQAILICYYQVPAASRRSSRPASGRACCAQWPPFNYSNPMLSYIHACMYVCMYVCR